MISIIVPIYNAEAYLPKCLDSLLAQTTDERLQIILVDDASSDNSLAIAHRYAEKDARIEVYRQEHAGQSAARNLGLQHAQGDFIAFVDADDSIAPDWCERHLKAMEGVDYVQSGYKRVRNTDGAVLNTKLPKNRYQFTSPCMRLYRRKAIAGMRFEIGSIYEDVRFSTNLWLSDATCRLIRYTGYLYTLNPESTTSTRHPQDEQQLFQFLREKKKGQSLKNVLIIQYTIFRLKLHYCLHV